MAGFPFQTHLRWKSLKGICENLITWQTWSCSSSGFRWPQEYLWCFLKLICEFSPLRSRWTGRHHLRDKRIVFFFRSGQTSSQQGLVPDLWVNILYHPVRLFSTKNHHKIVGKWMLIIVNPPKNATQRDSSPQRPSVHLKIETLHCGATGSAWIPGWSLHRHKNIPAARCVWLPKGT